MWETVGKMFRMRYVEKEEEIEYSTHSIDLSNGKHAYYDVSSVITDIDFEDVDLYIYPLSFKIPIYGLNNKEIITYRDAELSDAEGDFLRPMYINIRNEGMTEINYEYNKQEKQLNIYFRCNTYRNKDLDYPKSIIKFYVLIIEKPQEM